jgi:hypothetical protein
MAGTDEEFPAARGADRSVETPDADAAEQATPVDPAEQPDEVHRGIEADEYDAVEQSQVVVDLDEDYR